MSDVTIVTVRNINDLRTVATEAGFELNEGQGRPPLFAVAAAAKAHNGTILDFSEYNTKRVAGGRRVGAGRTEPTFTIRAVVAGVDQEVVTSPSEVKEFTGNAGKRGATSRNSYLEFAAHQWQVAVSELTNIRIEESLSAPRVVSVPTVNAEPVSEAPKVAPKRKSRAKGSKTASEGISASDVADVPVELDSAE